MWPGGNADNNIRDMVITPHHWTQHHVLSHHCSGHQGEYLTILETFEILIGMFNESQSCPWSREALLEHTSYLQWAPARDHMGYNTTIGRSRQRQMGLFLNFKIMKLIINTKKSNGHTLTFLLCGPWSAIWPKLILVSFLLNRFNNSKYFHTR